MNDNNDDDNECYGYDDDLENIIEYSIEEEIDDLENILEYSIEEEIEDFCRKMESEYGYTITNEDISYLLGDRCDYTAIHREAFLDILWYILNNDMTEEEIDNIEDLWLKTKKVGCEHSEFPFDKIVYTEVNALGLEVKEECSKELEEKIRYKTEYWFEKLVDEVRDLYDQLEHRYYESIKETVQNE